MCNSFGILLPASPLCTRCVREFAVDIVKIDVKLCNPVSDDLKKRHTGDYSETKVANSSYDVSPQWKNSVRISGPRERCQTGRLG